MNDLESEFRLARVRLGKTQEVAAREAGVSRKTVSDFESGNGSIRLANLKRLFQCVGLALTTRPATARPTLDELAALYPDVEEPPTPTARPRARRK